MTTTESRDLALRACPRCHSTVQQRYQERPDEDPTSWRHRCYVSGCGYDSGWQPWPPPWMYVAELQATDKSSAPKVGYTLQQVRKAGPARLQALDEAIQGLRRMRKLTLAWPDVRRAVEKAIEDLEELYARLS